MNVYATQTATGVSVPRGVFLDGRAECSICRAHVRPSAETREFVQSANAKIGTAWCGVCCTTNHFAFELRPLA